MTRALTQKDLTSSPIFEQTVKNLYTADLASAAERYSRLTVGLKGNIRFFSSPGRAELVGNHTDHNHGYVIATSVDMDVASAVIATDDGKITINSEGYPAFTVDTAKLQIQTDLYGTSLALVMGVVKGFLDRGRKVGGFIANMQSNIFKGAGVSSSAAFELLICEILNVLYNEGKIDFVEKAVISKYAENVYFGKPSGLMDQLTISRGGVSFMDFNDPSHPLSSTAPWNFADTRMVIINCGGDHCNLTNEYSAIREEMGEVAGYFGKTTLREVTYEQLLSCSKAICDKFGGRAYLRAVHYFKENERVKNAKNYLENNDLKGFLKMITESGRSSFTYLQNCYPSGDKQQPIPFALSLADNYDDVLACRVHGGGFAGTILTFLDKSKVDAFVSYMQGVFGADNVFALSIRGYGAVEAKY